MKLFIGIFIVASIFAYTSLTSACTEEIWEEYKAEYNKHYEDKEDDMMHFYTFCDNKKAIDEHNANYNIGEANYKLSINKLTDLTVAETAEYYKTHRKQKVRGRGRPKSTTTEAPKGDEEYEESEE